MRAGNNGRRRYSGTLKQKPGLSPKAWKALVGSLVVTLAAIALVVWLVTR